jgi:hypothetical protein
MKTSLLLLSIIIGLNFGCQKDPNCGEDIVVDSLQLSPNIKDGLLLNGTERIAYNNPDGEKMIFKSPTERAYSTDREVLSVICGLDDYQLNQKEVIEYEKYNITYTDSLNQNRVMRVNATFFLDDSLLYDRLEIIISEGNQILAWAPYGFRKRYNIKTRTEYAPAGFNMDKPFGSPVIDTIFNNQPYTSVYSFPSGYGIQYFNSYGILQFDTNGHILWTIESIK